MNPHSLRTWPRGSQALAIGTHNFAQDNGEKNLFSIKWSDNDAKNDRPQHFIFVLRV